MRFVLALTALLAVATTKASASDGAARRGEEVAEKDVSNTVRSDHGRKMRGNKRKGRSSKGKGKGTSSSSKRKGRGHSGGSSESSKDTADARTCGLFCEIKSPNFPGLQQCLRDQLPGETTYRGEPNVPKVVFSEDGYYYDFARHNAFGNRWPAAIVLAGNANGPTNESTIEEVQKALRCARDNGYKVSGRGKSHSYQRWGAMDGFVVIDMANSCAVLDVDRTQQGDHIIEGSKYIAAVKYGAGCNNAFVVASLASFDDSEGAMGLTGDCPSVGVVGFLMGGGQGDVTPYLGQATDVVHEVEMLDHEGNLLTASETENPDLFWALRGGGGGLGIVVSITYKVVESPLPPSNYPEDRRFSYITFSPKAPERAGEMVYELQEFLTGAPKEISSKYGGGGGGFGGHVIYLGDSEQMFEELQAYAPKLLNAATITPSFSTPRYSDMAMFRYCTYSIKVPIMARPQLRNITFEGTEYQLVDICQDLGIDGSYCGLDMPALGLFPTDCTNPVVLEAMKVKAADPQSFLNNLGPHPAVATSVGVSPFPDINGIIVENDIPGHILRRLSKQTWEKILDQDPGYPLGNHFTHGAPTLVGIKDTAYPHRHDDMWTLVDARPASSPGFHVYLKEELDNDPSKLMGYYNYLGSERAPDWQKIYFGDNYERLQRIKAKYDPSELFTKPMTPEMPYPSRWK